MKACVLLSGGIDSSTCLGIAVERYGSEEVIALCISYGQKHEKEMQAAIAVADYYHVRLLTVDLAKIFEFSDCSLLAHSEKEIPKGSYSHQIEGIKKREGNEEKPVSTYVPFRNGLFLSSAASLALSFDCEVLYYGIHADDAAGNAYPDCSQAFQDAINQAIHVGSGNALTVEAPFVGWTKADVVRKGLALGVPYELTWSCYEGGETPCHTCATCIDREAAFKENGLTDPLCR